MAFDPDQTMMSEINVTPLVDVMLVLLVVFIITAPLLAPQSLRLSLPRTVTVATVQSPHSARLRVDAQGRIELDGQALGNRQLADRLHSRAREPQFQVQLEADTAVPYGRVAELMAIAQKAGVARLSFLTEAP